jgi:hypothetical protein
MPSIALIPSIPRCGVCADSRGRREHKRNSPAHSHSHGRTHALTHLHTRPPARPRARALTLTLSPLQDKGGKVAAGKSATPLARVKKQVYVDVAVALHLWSSEARIGCEWRVACVVYCVLLLCAMCCVLWSVCCVYLVLCLLSRVRSPAKTYSNRGVETRPIRRSHRSTLAHSHCVRPDRSVVTPPADTHPNKKLHFQESPAAGMDLDAAAATPAAAAPAAVVLPTSEAANTSPRKRKGPSPDMNEDESKRPLQAAPVAAAVVTAAAPAPASLSRRVRARAPPSAIFNAQLAVVVLG